MIAATPCSTTLEPSYATNSILKVDALRSESTRAITSSSTMTNKKRNMTRGSKSVRQSVTDR